MKNQKIIHMISKLEIQNLKTYLFVLLLIWISCRDLPQLSGHVSDFLYLKHCHLLDDSKFEHPTYSCFAINHDGY